MTFVNGTTALLVLDGVHALNGIDDLNGRTDADAIDDAGHAAALLVAAFRPHVVVLILAPVDFTNAVARTLPDGTALIRLGDLDRVRTAGGRTDVRLRAHGDALHATVDTQAALFTSIIPSVTLDVLHVFVDAGLGQMLALVDGTAFALGHVPDGDAAVGAGRRQRSRTALGAVDFAGATVAAQLAAIVKDFFILVLLTFISTRRQLFADPDVAAAFLVLDLLRVRTLGRRRQIDERRTAADAVDLSAEGADAARVAALEEGLALRNGPAVVVAEVDFVATLPVMTAFAVFAEVLRLRAGVLRRHQADHAFGAAADFARVTLAIPVATVFEGFAVLIAGAFVKARTVDQPEVAFPSVRGGEAEEEGVEVVRFGRWGW